MDEAIATLVISNTSKDVIKNLEINVSDSKDVQLINEVWSPTFLQVWRCETT
jgi:hypothetical protein